MLECSSVLCEIKLLSHLSQCIKLASVKCVCSRLGAPDAQAHVLLDEHEETKLQDIQNACVRALLYLHSVQHTCQHRSYTWVYTSLPSCLFFSFRYDLYQSNFPCSRQPPTLPAIQPACQSVGSC